jgi:hypothetical protein
MTDFVFSAVNARAFYCKLCLTFSFLFPSFQKYLTILVNKDSYIISNCIPPVLDVCTSLNKYKIMDRFHTRVQLFNI